MGDYGDEGGGDYEGGTVDMVEEEEVSRYPDSHLNSAGSSGQDRKVQSFID